MAARRNETDDERKRRESKGTMTVAEAGQRGGEKTAETHSHEFYEEIGHKGGQRVKELIEEGKKAEGTTGSESKSRSSSRGSESESRSSGNR